MMVKKGNVQKYPSMGDSVKMLWVHCDLLQWGEFHSTEKYKSLFARVMCQITTRSTHYEAMTTGSFFSLQLGHPKIQTNNENWISSLQKQQMAAVWTIDCSTLLSRSSMQTLNLLQYNTSWLIREHCTQAGVMLPFKRKLIFKKSSRNPRPKYFKTRPFFKIIAQMLPHINFARQLDWILLIHVAAVQYTVS